VVPLVHKPCRKEAGRGLGWDPLHGAGAPYLFSAVGQSPGRIVQNCLRGTDVLVDSGKHGVELRVLQRRISHQALKESLQERCEPM
jgi:hypothetical protein